MGEACGLRAFGRKIADTQADRAFCLIPRGGVGQRTNVPCVQCRYEPAIVVEAAVWEEEPGVSEVGYIG